jgi:hypothetical protein
MIFIFDFIYIQEVQSSLIIIEEQHVNTRWHIYSTKLFGIYYIIHQHHQRLEAGWFLYVIVSNHAGANSSPWNPPPGGNPALKRTWIGATFKTCVVKTTFKLKLNIKRNPLNFKSIQWNHLQAFPIWWDYPFN